MTRRAFLSSVAGAGAAASASAQSVIAPPATTKKVAAVVTTYFRYSHADNIVTRFMEGYSIQGKSFAPPCKVASLFIEQVNDLDIGTPLAKRWKIPVMKSIAEALTLGTGKLAVDGVLLIGEHGDYPDDERGVKLYPRKRFFEEIVKVYRDSKRAAPVFNDKHLSWSFKEAKWIFDQAKELGFPLMAGSSVPVTHRHPKLYPEAGTEWMKAMSVGYGGFESYGFHTLEALQCMVENRKGGETGVKAVQTLQGKEAWEAAKAGRWDRELLDAALSTVPTVRKGRVEDNDKDALVYLIEYRDGLQGAAYLSRRHVGEWAFAGRARGKDKPLACWYEMPKPQRDHFSFLTGQIAKMFTTGKASYPVERTLLTGGMLQFLVDSLVAKGKRVETPDLGVRY